MSSYKQGKLHFDTPNLNFLAKKYNIPRNTIDKIINHAQKSIKHHIKHIPVIENGITHDYTVVRQGIGPLTTPYGLIWQYNFEINDIWKKYNVLIAGEINFNKLTPKFKNIKNLIIRIDSGCNTGQTFHDLTCDCREQLHLAMQMITQKGQGIIINIPAQDGRGMGLSFKLATLLLQKELGINTVESAGILSPCNIIDKRTYSGVIGILKFFGIKSKTIINLATNNPYKKNIFIENSYLIKRIPIIINSNKHTKHHLKAKEEILNHNFSYKND